MTSRETPSGRTFASAVSAVLDHLEPGDVLTYGEVAQEAGYPGGARAVGQFLKHNTGFPWWRIVNSKGRLAPGHETAQRQLLESEGVAIKDGHVVAMR